MPLAILGLVLALVIVILFNTIKILKEYERGVIFMLGRFHKVKGPGLIILIPFIQRMTKVELRVIVMDVPTQDVISRDNVWGANYYSPYESGRFQRLVISFDLVTISP